MLEKWHRQTPTNNYEQTDKSSGKRKTRNKRRKQRQKCKSSVKNDILFVIKNQGARTLVSQKTNFISLFFSDNDIFQLAQTQVHLKQHARKK